MKTSLSRLSVLTGLAILFVLLVFTAFPSGVQAATQVNPTPKTPTLADFNCTYVVRPGDNLFRISLRYGVSPFALAAVNRIGNLNLIFVGMVLRVPCPATPPPPGPPPPPNVCATYVVVRGDWLSTIAARFHVSWQSIAALNHLSNPNLIFPGMHLAIPCPGGTSKEVIVITQPTTNQIICSPVTVKGSTNFAPFEAQLLGQVVNQNGTVIGSGSIHMDVPAGQAGTFSRKLTFDTNKITTYGSVVVSDISAKDGSVLATAKVPILFAVNPSPC
jgi:LysM repeat protein